MARPGKSVEAKLEIIDAKIAKVEAQLKGLKDERKALEAQQKELEFTELVKLMNEKGVSVAQIREMVEQN